MLLCYAKSVRCLLVSCVCNIGLMCFVKLQYTITLYIIPQSHPPTRPIFSAPTPRGAPILLEAQANAASRHASTAHGPDDRSRGRTPWPKPKSEADGRSPWPKPTVTPTACIEELRKRKLARRHANRLDCTLAHLWTHASWQAPCSSKSAYTRPCACF